MARGGIGRAGPSPAGKAERHIRVWAAEANRTRSGHPVGGSTRMRGLAVNTLNLTRLSYFARSRPYVFHPFERRLTLNAERGYPGDPGRRLQEKQWFRNGQKWRVPSRSTSKKVQFSPRFRLPHLHPFFAAFALSQRRKL